MYSSGRGLQLVYFVYVGSKLYVPEVLSLGRDNNYNLSLALTVVILTLKLQSANLGQAAETGCG